MGRDRGPVFVVKFLHGDQERIERDRARVAEIRSRAGLYDGPGSIGGRELFVEWSGTDPAPTM